MTMTSQTNVSVQLAETVAGELVAVRGVLDLLAQESTALLARDAGLLAAVSNAKAAAVARAAELGQQRQALLQRNPGLDQSGVTSALEKLRALAVECRQQNEANGLMIRGQRRRIEGALNILRGGQPGGEIYGRDGAATRLRQVPRGALAAW